VGPRIIAPCPVVTWPIQALRLKSKGELLKNWVETVSAEIGSQVDNHGQQRDDVWHTKLKLTACQPQKHAPATKS
jgi:hypothetical protein